MRLKTIAYLILIIIVLNNPASTFQYAYQGLYQWAVRMVPTLFPFMMLSSIMIYSGADIELGKLLNIVLKRVYSYSRYGLYAVFMGFLCGFPMGAKVISELYENKKINRSEALSLLSFCNNIGPAYFLGIVLPMLKTCGCHNSLPFLFGMYGIPAVYGIVLSHVRPPADHGNHTPSLPAQGLTASMPSILKRACLENTQSLILLGGYITFTNSFRILLDFVPISSDISAVASSFVEIIGGIQAIYTTSLGNPAKVFWIMTSLCFGGISCFLQTSCFLEKSKLPLLYYFKHKLFMTLLSALYYGVVLCCVY
ncbi:MAG: hypothetical protein NC337_10515 [Roseburia sp.]|nr:hypothetical protein [Roseburia sp.]